MSTQQDLLSSFDAGDTNDVRLSTESLDERKRTKEYIRDQDCGGWRAALVSEDVIWWDDPDTSSAKTAKIERNAHGWSGRRKQAFPGPTNESDLQTAIDEMVAWLQDHPLEADR